MALMERTPGGSKISLSPGPQQQLQGGSSLGLRSPPPSSLPCLRGGDGHRIRPGLCFFSDTMEQGHLLVSKKDEQPLSLHFQGPWSGEGTAFSVPRRPQESPPPGSPPAAPATAQAPAPPRRCSSPPPRFSNASPQPRWHRRQARLLPSVHSPAGAARGGGGGAGISCPCPGLLGPWESLAGSGHTRRGGGWVSLELS